MTLTTATLGDRLAAQGVETRELYVSAKISTYLQAVRR